MAHLSLPFPGPFTATLGGDAVRGLDYGRIRALLAILAAAAERPHHHSTLANPHQAISARHVDPHLVISPQAIQLNLASHYALVMPACASQPKGSREDQIGRGPEARARRTRRPENQSRCRCSSGSPFCGTQRAR